MIIFLVEIYARGDNPDNPPLRYLSAPLDPQYPARNNIKGKPAQIRLAIPDFNVKLSDAISGIILHQTFNFSLVNNDGYFDNYGMEKLFNVEVNLKKAIKEKPDYSDFTEIRSGLIESVRTTFESVGFTVTDRLRSFEEPVCDVIRQEDFPFTVDDEAIGKEKPVIYGEVVTGGIRLNETDYYIAENVEEIDKVKDKNGDDLEENRHYTISTDALGKKNYSIITMIPHEGNIRELGSLKATGNIRQIDGISTTRNTIGAVIIDLLHWKSKYEYNDTNFDFRETRVYRERSAPINIKFTGGTVRKAIEACLKSDMAYLIQKNDDRLSIRQYAGTYGGDDNRGIPIPAWAITQKPTKDYELAQKMWFSSCLVRYDYDYLENRHERSFLNNAYEDFATVIYKKKQLRMVFETNLPQRPQDTTQTYHARRLSALLSARFTTLRETIRLGVGIDTSEMNLLDIIIFEEGINVNGRVFSTHREWIIREINPAQDKLVLEEMAPAIWLYENDVLITDWIIDNQRTLDRVFDWIGRNAESDTAYLIVLGHDVTDITACTFNENSVNTSTDVIIILEGSGKERTIRKGSESAGEGMLFALRDGPLRIGGFTIKLGENITFEEEVEEEDD